MDCLKVPTKLAGRRIECQQRIGIAIVARPVRTIEVGRGRSRRGKDDPALFIKRHASPVIGTARRVSGIRGPMLRPRLAIAGNGLERPAQLAGTHVECANVSGSARCSFAGAEPCDDQVAVNDPRSGQEHRQRLRIAPQAFPQVDPTVLAKALDRLAARRIERVEVCR